MSEDEGESHGTDCTGSEGPPLASRVVQPTSPRSVEAVALEPSGTPVVQESRQSSSGSQRWNTRRGWRSSASVRKAAAMPSVRLHEGAHPRRLPDLLGHDTEGEVGHGPCEAAVPALSAAPPECGM
jgi:hypothetical protein